MKVLLNTSYAFWKELRKEPERYYAEKQKITEILLDALEGRFPGIHEQAKVFDVATPMTIERYTGVEQGYEVNMGFGGMMSFLRGQPKTLPGLKNFYMIGSTVGGAGIPGCAAMGRNVIKKICKNKRIDFSPKSA